MNSSAGFEDASAYGGSVSPTKESPSCSKLDAEKPYSSSNRSGFSIGSSSYGAVPEVDDLSRGDFISETKALAPDVEMLSDTMPDKASVLSSNTSFRLEFRELVMTTGNDPNVEGFIGGIRLAWVVC
ncbi:hypothetical protein JHK85_025301 [Glycine max]|nr:hypothetical protein JHK85_025301 [Glycine max]